MHHDDWFDGLIDVAQFPVIDNTALGIVRRSSRLAGSEPSEAEPKRVDPSIASTSNTAAARGPPTGCEPCEPNEEKIYVVFQGKASGVVVGTFDQVRKSHLKGHQDPIYEEFNDMEEATMAWDRYCQSELREPPTISPRVMPTTSMPDQARPQREGGSGSLVGKVPKPSSSLALMNFEAPVMSTEDDQSTTQHELGSEDNVRTSTTHVHLANTTTRDSKWWPLSTPSKATARLGTSTSHHSAPSPITPEERQQAVEAATSNLVGAAAGWIAFLVLMLPCTYLVGAGYLTATKGGTAFATTAAVVASSVATAAAGATGVDGLLRATMEIFRAAGSAVNQFTRHPMSLAPWAVVLFIMILLHTAASEPNPKHTELASAPRPQQTVSQAIVAMAEDQSIFELVTPGEARSLIGEISLLHRGSRILVLGDSCAASGVGNHPNQFMEGTLRDAVTVVNTAGGEITCSQRGTLAVRVVTSKGPMVLTVEDAILNTACPYVLIPVGKLSRTKGIELYMPPWGKDGYFQYPNGVRIRMVNRNVWVI